ncbi:carbohydrate ABC transporter permease [Paenibacillus oryzisoli]|uniref:Sugar ABC transporter permease n=1 Tax=Paenibacillus oryzisoli TaxID=1850517 RepID=A0A198ACP2_9BACL|nr:carbohydrate ABC transporter permease [Paenibacillus oryzisoli]OAS18713.1 sugar ABC transporter permease [Paenibacillus oryzisoli]
MGLGRIQRYSLELVLLLASLAILIPIAIMVLGSLKSPAEAQYFNLDLPSQWHFDNYVTVFNNGGMGRAFKNSMIITFFGVCLTVIFAAMCSFTIARKNSRYTQFLFILIILGMIAPFSVVPTIGLMQILRLSGTYASVIFIYIAINISYSVFIFTGFIKSVPRELDEAGIVDGCGPYRMFFRIILPLLQPVLVTNIIITTMSIWNEFMIPLYFFNTAAKWTLPLTVYNFFGQYAGKWNLVFANLMITVIPIVIIFLLGQKYIVTGMTSGAVKG